MDDRFFGRKHIQEQRQVVGLPFGMEEEGNKVIFVTFQL